MATISKYQNATGATLYRVRYRTPDRGQTQKRGFRTKREAEIFAASVEVSKLKGEYVSPSNARLTSWGARYTLAGKPAWPRKACVVSGVRYCMANPRMPEMGPHTNGDIRPTGVQSWISDMSLGTRGAKRSGASVIIHAHHVLLSILDDAVRDNMLAKNPARGMSLPKPNRKRPVYLTHDEVGAVAEASGEFEALVLLLAYTGLRWGEAIGLRVKDLDLLRHRATVGENAVEVGRQIHVGTSKSHKSRTVPLPKFLVPYLAKQCEGKGRDMLLFSDENGGHLHRPHSSSGWFNKAVSAAGVPRITPHDLRHSAASLAVSAGANVKAVQRMLGHASAAMTLDVYADLFDDDLESVAAAMDRARSQARDHARSL
ncbi:tyrosine-type recombinase/integrase [Mycobacterium sp. 236(2023)]|uniref:tyrosine-type recombinase/integrase n=1 Tax=Mycobacterium sp. 236(2023) TaxID=3038163 RepID=UPI003242B20C